MILADGRAQRKIAHVVPRWRRPIARANDVNHERRVRSGRGVVDPNNPDIFPGCSMRRGLQGTGISEPSRSWNRMASPAAQRALNVSSHAVGPTQGGPGRLVG